MTSHKLLAGLILGIGLTLAMPARAAAQVHLQLVGGMSDAASREPFFAAGVGVRAAFVEFNLEGGHFKDILPQGVLDALNDLQRDRGLPVQGIASVPATYGLASVRVIPGVGPIRPFVSGGLGVARLQPRIEVVVDGISFGDVFGLTSLGSRTEPMAMVSAGIRIDPGPVHVEAGYRYVGIFSDFRTINASGDNVLIHVGAIYGALGVRF